LIGLFQTATNFLSKRVFSPGDSRARMQSVQLVARRTRTGEQLPSPAFEKPAREAMRSLTTKRPARLAYHGERRRVPV